MPFSSCYFLIILFIKSPQQHTVAQLNCCNFVILLQLLGAIFPLTFNAPGFLPIISRDPYWPRSHCSGVLRSDCGLGSELLTKQSGPQKSQSVGRARTCLLVFSLSDVSVREPLLITKGTKDFYKPPTHSGSVWWWQQQPHRGPQEQFHFSDLLQCGWALGWQCRGGRIWGEGGVAFIQPLPPHFRPV